MKYIWVLLFFTPIMLLSQSKKKRIAIEKQANMMLENNLRTHVQLLASDSFEGRRAGTSGELLAMQYIINQYKKLDIEPKGDDGYVQSFIIDDGKQILPGANYLSVNNKVLILNTDYFPLAFSKNDAVSGNAAMALNEKGEPWFFDIKYNVEDNLNNLQFDINNLIKSEALKAAKKGATALFIYNSSSLIDNVQFARYDTSSNTNIPVVYITNNGYLHYFTDATATLTISLKVSISKQVRTAHNVVAFINNQAKNTVILSAHYDHLGFGEDGNALDTGHIVHHGADDNASGTAALIELARLLKQSSAKNNNYLIIHFSGEELGLLGSKYWLQHPTISIQPNYMINIDMVGRYDTTHKLTIGGFGTSPYWSNLFQNISHKNLLIKFDSTGSGPSDHDVFYRMNIPVLFFFTGSHSDYHKSTDDWNKINYSAEREIVHLITSIISTADTQSKLAFTKTTEASLYHNSKFTVSLGILPDYAFTGNGVKIDGISPGKIAEKIGLQVGDVLLKLGSYAFSDVMSYMNILSKFKKGDKTSLTFKRNDKQLELPIEF